MFFSVKKYDVIPLSYEYLHPTLAQLDKTSSKVRKTLKGISSLPDFVIIPKDKEKPYLVEVKYRGGIKSKNIHSIAQTLLDGFEDPWLFIGSKNGFYFDSCQNILEDNNSTIAP